MRNYDNLFTKTSRCGDGMLDVDSGEQCDDGNDDPADDCVGEYLSANFNLLASNKLIMSLMISLIIILIIS